MPLLIRVSLSRRPSLYRLRRRLPRFVRKLFRYYGGARDVSAEPGSKPLVWPPIKVDVEVPPEQISAMIRLVEGNWAALGHSEPHWSVLTGDSFKSENIKDNKQAFYQSGWESFQLMAAAAARCGIDMGSLRTCLELGCGVGRVTIWLAKQFRSVIAVDVSQPHISLAESAARCRRLDNITFRHVNSLQSISLLPSFDALYSFIVLQHNPPPVIFSILDTLLAKITPGGIAYFQLPTYWVDYSFDAAEYLACAEVHGTMEMHVLPQYAVFSLAAKHGCEVLEVREDSSTGLPSSISNCFFLQKTPGWKNDRTLYRDHNPIR